MLLGPPQTPISEAKDMLDDDVVGKIWNLVKDDEECKNQDLPLWLLSIGIGHPHKMFPKPSMWPRWL